MQKRKKDRLPESVSLLEVISSHVAIVLNEPLLLLLLLVFLHSPGNDKPSTKMTFETDRWELDCSFKNSDFSDQLLSFYFSSLLLLFWIRLLSSFNFFLQLIKIKSVARTIARARKKRMKNETLERRIKIHQQLLGTRLIARPVAENCWSFLIIKKLCLNQFLAALFALSSS